MANSSSISLPYWEAAEPHLIIAGNSQQEWVQTKTPELTSKRLFNYLLLIFTKNQNLYQNKKIYNICYTNI